MPNSNHLSKALNKAIGKMLKPLVKLLMHKGITYIGLQNLLKETYVDVANQDVSFQLNNKRQTDSRISLLTGVHRKEVKRIRGEICNIQTDKEIKASISAQMMAKWLGHQDFIDKNGDPKPLHKQHSEKLSFSDLVFTVSRDKHPRSILDDWIQQGLVTIDKDQLIWLNKDGYTAPADMEEKLFFAGKNISEHLKTVTQNLISAGSENFDRAVYYHHLSSDSVSEIEALTKKEMLRALKVVNKKAAQLQQQDSESSNNADQSIHVGAYFSQSKKEDES